MYGHREHRINLFVWPAGSAPDSVPSANMREGYNLVHWVAGGMNQWAISDLNAVELREFADDLRKLPAEP